MFTKWKKISLENAKKKPHRGNEILSRWRVGRIKQWVYGLIFKSRNDT